MGKFSQEDEDKLIAIVQKLEASNIRNSETLTPLIELAQTGDFKQRAFWGLVAADLGNRTHQQCMYKW